MKKQLKENNEDKRLMAASVYLNLYMGILEEFVDEDDEEIYFHESGNKYAKVCIFKKSSQCWVDSDFWDEFSVLFLLSYVEVKSIIIRWIEYTYKLKGIDVISVFRPPIPIK